MASWNQIEDGMPKGGTAIQEALVAINAGPDTSHYSITAANMTDPASVTYSDGAFYRYGRLVVFVFHGTAKAPASDTATQVVLNVPNGYKPAAELVATQYPLSWAQSATVTAQRAFMTATNGGQIQWRMAAGNAYIGGAWMTNDDFPD